MSNTSRSLGHVQGLEDLQRKLKRLARYGAKNEKEVQKAHRQVAKIGVKAVRNQITDYPELIKVRRGNRKNKGKRGPNYDIQSGNLRKSVGVSVNVVNRMNVLIVPKSGMVARERRAPQEGQLLKSDGYYAHMVEMGVKPRTQKGFRGFMGGKGEPVVGPKNKGFFSKGINASMSAMQAEFVAQHRKLWKKAAR